MGGRHSTPFEVSCYYMYDMFEIVWETTLRLVHYAIVQRLGVLF